MAKSSNLQRKWALVGAEARLKEVQSEIDEIYRVFPELRGRQSVSDGHNALKVKRFSPAGRAAISDGMRKYWARRKAAAAKAAKTGAKS